MSHLINLFQTGINGAAFHIEMVVAGKRKEMPSISRTTKIAQTITAAILAITATAIFWPIIHLMT